MSERFLEKLLAKDLRARDGGGNEREAGPALGSGEGEANRSVLTEGGGQNSGATLQLSSRAFSFLYGFQL